MFKQTRTNKQKGFTLVEVMTVMVIIGILIYAASSSIPNIANDYTYKSNITKLDYMVKNAKLLAIQKTKYIAVYANYNENKFEVRDIGYSIISPLTTSSGSLLKTITLEGVYKIKNSGNNSQDLIFDGRGIAIKTGTPCISNGIRYATAVVSFSGVRVDKGDGTCP